MLAGIETVVTFSLAYPAAVALGAVLLQTAPQRGLPGGRMEAFLRAMREVGLQTFAAYGVPMLIITHLPD